MAEQQQQQNGGTVDELLQKVQAACLRRGASGINGLGRAFRIFDDDRSGSLCKEEFRKAMHDYQTGIDAREADMLFEYFDSDGSGSIVFDEFLKHVRPPMSGSRIKLVREVFAKADRTGDGVINHEDLKKVYSAKQHPKYKSGEWSERKVFDNFLATFQPPGSADDTVTMEEFINYYSGLSPSIDLDVYFDFMMRSCWKL